MKAILFALAATVATPAMAANYIQANFSGQLASNANVKAPFNGAGFTGGQSVTGSFVFDADLIPNTPFPGSNLFFNNFADIADIPAADAFTINFGPYVFTLADNLDAQRLAGIQYVNGQFNGFVFLTDFLFQNQWYRFRTEGATFNVRKLTGQNGNITGGNLITGTLNLGLTDQTPYVIETPAVPEPATWAMMIAGFGAVGFAMRRARRNVRVSFA